MRLCDFFIPKLHALVLLVDVSLPSTGFGQLPTPPTPLPPVPQPPSPPTPEPPTPDPNPPADEVHGYDLYLEQCALCHGTDGEGTDRGYPIILLPKAYATEVIRQGRSGNDEFKIPMPAYDDETISDYQLAQMYEAIYKPLSAKTGKSLYLTYCSNCHGLEGEGGMSKRPVSTKLDQFKTFIRQGAGRQDYLNRNLYMPRWNARQISDDDIQLMIQYIKGENS
ncbi:c-type cytochrome [Pseudobacteriovorax antillogorgiicola]|uniref:Cytochrome C oxidase, cbb3-type, subunit III n=1 Tax=Pseudobacteriovorax antillogorgiicola TaxID=1513793 RepID=A0A1Y6BFB9_9BACT|nr:c-type cytochrome [Pseudobacteriovorax antillogorgiicola]TCS56323.1 cbb3-type cytochrome c oxidase subunit III [Pseudobacteriovorax antillogorgiicola]SMF07064.1 Cytochrome C oxidase, cbb3-type, subunit III [Pseudobacteriovorax antillogorgiicola]